MKKKFVRTLSFTAIFVAFQTMFASALEFQEVFDFLFLPRTFTAGQYKFGLVVILGGVIFSILMIKK